MVNTESQYERFFDIIDKFDEYNIFSLYNNKNEISFFLVINEFFINKLVNDSNKHHIRTIFNSYRSKLILENLYKYNIIPFNVYYLFSKVSLVESKNFELFNFFYFDIESSLFKKVRRYISFDEIFYEVYIITNVAYDVKMLEYCVDLLERFNIKAPSYLSNYYKVPLNFPLNLLKYYTEKIFTSNCLTLCHKNKYFESLINIVLSDGKLNAHLDNSNKLFNFKPMEQLKRYEIDINTIKKTDFKISYKTEKIIQTYLISFNIEHENSEYNNPNSKEENLISKIILNNYYNVQKILKDYNSLFTFNINFKKELFLIHITFIISLIHNNYNKFIIKYLVSFLFLNRSITTIYEDNKIVFYYQTNTDYIFENYYINTLLDVPNKTFRSYINFKEDVLLPNEYIDNCIVVDNIVD